MRELARYFALAGLKLDDSSTVAPDGWIGLDTDTQEIPASSPHSDLLVTDVVAGSPAAAAGLGPGDRITAIERMPATAKILSDAVKPGPGANIQISWTRASNAMSAVVRMAQNFKRAYRFEIADSATDAQKQILNRWLGSEERGTSSAASEPLSRVRRQDR